MYRYLMIRGGYLKIFFVNYEIFNLYRGGGVGFFYIEWIDFCFIWDLIDYDGDLN